MRSGIEAAHQRQVLFPDRGRAYGAHGMPLREPDRFRTLRNTWRERQLAESLQERWGALNPANSVSGVASSCLAM
jgi:hypothetical protein